MAVIQRKELFTTPRQQPQYFSDFLNNIDIHPVKKDLFRYLNEEAVKRSIKNILFTNRGERFFNPNFGASLNDLLFENYSVGTESVIKSSIQTAIENYEPRASVQEIKVEGETDTNTLLVTIVFSILNKEDPITMEVILNRIR